MSKVLGFLKEKGVFSGDSCGRPSECLVSTKDFVPVVSAEFIEGLIAELDQSFVWTCVKSSRDWEKVKKIIIARVCREAKK